jgi:energy-coupling factor transporter ATP-binding protein EcfA2
VFEFQPVDRPYPGLRPFEPHEAEIFFGRERHTDRLLAILQRERFLAVIGPSGSGKSSLVRAGLLSGLAMGSLGTGSDWRIALLRPGDRPMRSLAAALLQPQVLGRHLLATPQAEPGEADIAALEAELRRGPQGLAQLVGEAQRRHREAAVGADASAWPPPAFNLLVLVDQFEEIFTYADAGGRAAADESEAFIALLLAAAEQARRQLDQPGLYVALTMRTDFLGNCVRFADLPEAINQAQYLTPRLKRDEIERAIAGPAELWGGQIEPSLVAELINATGQSSDQLPLVQHALARMWAEALRRNPDAPCIDRKSVV